MKFGKIRGIKHYVFESLEEYENYFMSKNGVVSPVVSNWRHAKQGDWVWSDDNHIVQILKWGELKHPHDRKNWKASNGYVRTIVGSFIQTDKAEMDTDFSIHKSRYSFNGVGIDESIERRKTRPNLTKAERMFVFELMSGKNLREAYELCFGETIHWKEKVLLLLKTKRIKTMVEKSLKSKMDEKGVGIEFILDALKELFQKSKNDNVKLGALRELGEYYGAKEQAKKIDVNQYSLINPIHESELQLIEAQEVKALVGAED